MKRERVERLKAIFDDAWAVVRNEWDFGEFSTKIDADEKEAEQIFAELLAETE